MKKKTFKKAGVAVLSMAMLLSMGAMALPVSAAGTALPANSAITINAAQGKFKLYKVAEATKNAQTGAITYTVSNNFSSVLTVKNGYVVTSKAITSPAIANETQLKTLINHGAGIEAVAKELEAVARNKTTPVAPIQTTTITAGDADSKKLTVTEAGYYLILGDSVAKTQPVLVNILPDTALPAITVKNSDIPFIKAITKITDTNSASNLIGTDLEGNAGGSGISEEGGVVQYTLTTEFPKYDEDVRSLTDKFIITDIPEDSIVIDMNSITVKVNSATVTTGFTTAKNITFDKTNKNIKVNDTTTTTNGLAANNDFVTTVNEDGKGFQITFDDATVLGNGGKSVEVVFNATVTNADVDGDSNDNGATLSYSNNYFTGKGSVTYTENKPEPEPGQPEPDEPDDGTPVEDEDNPKVIPDDAFIYCSVVTVNKQDPEGTALKGAVFELYYLDPNNNNEEKLVKALGETAAKIDDPANPGTQIDNPNYISTFSFRGLGDGTYVLREKTAPAGYTKAEDTTVTITAGKVVSTNVYNGTFTKTGTNNGIVTVTDQPTQELPGTGGIGTYLFTIGGAALVLLAGALFVVYLRKRKTEE